LPTSVLMLRDQVGERFARPIKVEALPALFLRALGQ